MRDLPTFDAPMLLEPRASGRLATLSADIRAALAVEGQLDLGGQGYEVTAGVAVIQVSGVLVPKLGIRQSLGFVTGYDGVRVNLVEALADDQVRAVVLMVDSPGGYVAGLFDLADQIYALRGGKPIVAILDEMAASAAYCLASAADVVTVPRSGIIGSVGSIMLVADISRSLANAGVEMHVVHFGAAKAVETRAALTGMTSEALASIQGDIDAIGEMFVAIVARNRGLSIDAVRAQEAACFLGRAGVASGLADSVLAPDQAFGALLADLDAA